ncbi:hypothetical protein [Massilia sp.]|uniref:hypothetical protein n=1 Tax=Massilia sp. TaxID=1882437 RepID=UPI00352DF5BC
MRILDVIRQLMPAGPVAEPQGELLDIFSVRVSPSYQTCPTWPPDLFAVAGTIIDRSGCYTQASPNRDDLPAHEAYLQVVQDVASSWNNLLEVPVEVAELWASLVAVYGEVALEDIRDIPDVQSVLFTLFAIADEVSQGMGWDTGAGNALNDFATAVLITAALEPGEKPLYRLPDWPNSLCRMVPADQVVVLPKSITTDKGCTIRSLSHNLALLPCRTVLDSEWRLVSRDAHGDGTSELRLLLVPFPYAIPPDSFILSSARRKMKNGSTHAAFFGLDQKWLKTKDGKPLSSEALAKELILPLIAQATVQAGGKKPHGVVLPECALDEDTTVGLIDALKGSGIEFLIAGVLEYDEQSGRWLNQAYTLFMDSQVAKPQSKHHRWRIDRRQANSYGLDFDSDPDNAQWWEDIDVSMRRLPFYAFRKDTSLVTLICEDLARMEPAMNAIRAVGPNLVVALLMDGPQLGWRWPGRYAGVLADEPGCAVLSLTCAATVDLSNTYYVITDKPDKPPARIVARWTQATATYDIELPDNANGVLLTLQSDARHQTTLDNRSDQSHARALSFTSQQPIYAGTRPDDLT